MCLAIIWEDQTDIRNKKKQTILENTLTGGVLKHYVEKICKRNRHTRRQLQTN